MFLFGFAFPESDQLFFLVRKVEAADGLAVVVVEQDPEVGFGVPVVDPGERNLLGKDGLDDVEGLHLVQGRIDAIVIPFRGILIISGSFWRFTLFFFVEGGFEAFLDDVADHRAERLPEQFRELFKYSRSDHFPGIDLFREKPHQMFTGVRHFSLDQGFQLVGVLKLTGSTEYVVDVKIGFMEFLEFVDLIFPDITEIDFEEGFFVHFVWLFQIGIEPVYDAVCEDTKLGLGNVEIPKKLAIMEIEVLRPVFTLDQDGRFAVFEYGVIDFLALFGADVANELRNDFQWIENIVTQGNNEWHDKSVFCGFLSVDLAFQFFDPVS